MPLQEHVLTLLREMDRRYQERFEAQTKALDAAFLAQQTAMQAALLAAEKAVQTAMTASDRAVTKAEMAAEKRFDAVNEFRGAYQDIISQQMPRAEAEQRIQQLAEKIDDLKRDNFQRLGQATGARESHAQAQWSVSQLVTVGAALLAAAIAVVALVLR